MTKEGDEGYILKESFVRHVDTTCLICLETVQIPIEPTCFDCHSTFQNNTMITFTFSSDHEEDNEFVSNYHHMTTTRRHSNESNDDPTTIACDLDDIGCYAYQRLCLHCFHTYLDMTDDRPQHGVYKCLLCTGQWRRDILENKGGGLTDGLFRTDFLFMKLYPHLETHELQTCRYCLSSERFFTQLSLYRHLKTTCEGYLIECKCGDTMTRKKWRDHHMECAAYSTCQFCQKRIVQDDEGSHYFSKHQHIMCYMCAQYIPVHTSTHHFIQECPHRLESCLICFRMIRHSVWLDHLQEHVETIQTEWNRHRQDITRLQHELEYLENALRHVQPQSRLSLENRNPVRIQDIHT